MKVVISGSKYPDKRSMGFPFDRTTSHATVEDLVNEIPNRQVYQTLCKFFMYKLQVLSAPQFFQPYQLII